MIEFNRFQSNKVGGHPNWCEELPINRYSESGLYVNRNNERLIVCDHPFERFVVILDHKEFGRFLTMNLGDFPIDEGFYFRGAMNCNLPDFDGIKSRKTEPGVLKVRSSRLELFVENPFGVASFQVISYGYGSKGVRYFDRWTLVDDWSEVTFNYDANSEDAEDRHDVLMR
ncbi:hypothetical protein GRI62_11550 [Erythrobacter arachoides]|uniref:Uncharacterized protein n=1 Tax=Aurantiacibacter arachoides TaxID=1850444 RepID=A0A845A3L7_9SPHN|nr:hypothetical protein [Aurantiacibacter arachoides]MXO94230.1 hypothetical protein [Aurantiacibacter arachoides]GGD65120.1 hypothetical protein GCM10011411_26780 [Aurantiacibacter arachoides]